MRHAAPEHDHVGIEHVDDRRERARQAVGVAFKLARRVGIAGGGPRGNGGGIERRTGRLEIGACQSGARQERLDAPVQAAVAGGAGPLIVYAISALSPFLVPAMDLTRTQYGSLATLTFAAAAVSSMRAGRAVDTTNARTVMFWLVAGAAGALLAAAVAPNYPVLVVAVVGKLGGAGVAARVVGEGWRDAWTIGVLMNTRGLTEIVILTVGLDAGVIGPPMFTAMVLMALLTTAMATPALRLLGVTPGLSGSSKTAGRDRATLGP